MWDVSAPFVRGWIRDELGPEAALADRVREDVDTLLRLPALIRRIEERYPPKAAAPYPPPLPRIELMWNRRRRRGGLGTALGYLVALAAGAGIALGGAAEGWW
jgi:ubiquinone biosynthesis protein